VDVHTFTKYANEGFVFQVPVVIKEQFTDALDFDEARAPLIFLKDSAIDSYTMLLETSLQ